jgi:glycogen operon protein
MRDLYACNGKNNNQAWPYGPSDGGEDDNNAWDQGGDAKLQRQAARTGFALLMLSSGVPMLTGGDEFLRSQRCNNNAYNLDSIGNWIDWSQEEHQSAFWGFAQGMIALRAEHPALRPSRFFGGRDEDGDGLEDIRWVTDAGTKATGAYMGDASKHFLGWIIDGDEAGDSAKAIYVAYNGWSGTVTATLPPPTPGKSWWRVTDTAAWMEGQENFAPAGHEDRMTGASYDLAGHSLLVLVER